MTEEEQALFNAIENKLRADNLLNEGWMLGDLIVMAELQSFTEEDADKTHAHIILSAIPWHRILGLIQVTLANLQRSMEED